MKEQILQIAHSLKKGVIDEQTARTEFLDLFGVSNSDQKPTNGEENERFTIMQEDEESDEVAEVCPECGAKMKAQISGGVSCNNCNYFECF